MKFYRIYEIEQFFYLQIHLGLTRKPNTVTFENRKSLGSKPTPTQSLHRWVFPNTMSFFEKRQLEAFLRRLIWLTTISF